MFITEEIARLQEKVYAWRQAGEQIGFVPTMGNLHDGHIALIKRARIECDRVIASIFVNPTQFGRNEDFASYPRTLDADKEVLEPVCDLLFLPDSETIYPDGFLTNIDIAPITTELCGKYRPNHFSGVLTIVNLLLNLVQPQRAYFGLKDYQQYWLICRMVADLRCSVAIVGVDTGRDVDGLALSSRNQYLTTIERSVAPLLYKSLIKAAKSLNQLDRKFVRKEYQTICQNAFDQLTQAGFHMDYFTLRDADTLLLPTHNTSCYRLLGAGRLGKARLIDNITLNHQE